MLKMSKINMDFHIVRNQHGFHILKSVEIFMDFTL